jgi:predicted DNA-binding transcriptional regulator AlpA
MRRGGPFVFVLAPAIRTKRMPDVTEITTNAKRSTKRDPETPLAANWSQEPLRLLSKSEILAIAGVSYPTLWAWMRQNRFPRSRIVGGRSMWLTRDIEAWLGNLPLRKLKGDKTEAAA